MNIDELFGKCLALHMSKKHDYASEIDAHENFKRSAHLAQWFQSDQDKSYVVLIGTKIARLATLLDGNNPNHEGIEDTFMDLVNYCALWAERRTNQPRHFTSLEKTGID